MEAGYLRNSDNCGSFERMPDSRRGEYQEQTALGTRVKKGASNQRRTPQISWDLTFSNFAVAYEKSCRGYIILEPRIKKEFSNQNRGAGNFLRSQKMY